MLKLSKAYVWRGIDPTARRVQGHLIATNLAELRTQLQRREILLIQATLKWRLISTRRTIKPQHILELSRQLSSLLLAGLPLVEALELLAQQYTQLPEMRQRLVTIKSEIEDGVTFSAALDNHSEYFSVLYRSLLRIGEQSGDLSGALMQLASYQEKMLDLKQKIRKALLYPMLLLSTAGIVLILLMVWVVPQFAQLFLEMGTPLPWLTRLVIGTSQLIQAVFPVMVVLTVILCMSFLVFRNHWMKGARLLQAYALKLPGVGMALRHSLLARFTRTLGMTLGAGLTVVEGLTAASEVVSDTNWKIGILQARNAVIAGIPLTQALQASQLFPPVLLQMVKVGQVSGELALTFHRLADFFDRKLTLFVKTMTDLLEPALLLFLGVFVGGLVIALYWPIFELGSVI